MTAVSSAQVGQHGDAPASVQTKRLDDILPANVRHGIPPRLDPVMFKSSLPAGIPFDEKVIDLGRKLYFDVRLSNDDSVSCATCHDVTRGFTDQRGVSEGIDDKLGRRNAPTTLNVALVAPLFWDGRAATLEQQAVMPILNPIEMGMPDEASVIAKLSGIEEYPKLFQEAFGRAITYSDIGHAIAAFERTLVFLDAPFDRWIAGDENAISAAAKQGFDLFNGKARCVSCHPMNQANPLGTDFAFHNIGVSARHQDFEGLAKRALQALEQDSSEAAIDRLALSTDMSELGRFVITRRRSDIGGFRTPQLRNIGLTAPYMHDGTMHSLHDVIDHYNKGGEDNLYLDGGIESLALTEPEVEALVEFLFTLTDVRFAEEQAMIKEKQKARAATIRPFRDDALANRKKLGFEDRVFKQGGK